MTTNTQRAFWAQYAVDAFVAKTHSDKGDAIADLIGCGEWVAKP